MSWSNPVSYTVGEVLTASNLNTYLSANLNFLANAPQGNLTLSSTAGNIAITTWAPFGGSNKFTPTVANGVSHQTGSGYDSLEVPVAGTYHCSGGVKWPNGSGANTVGGSVWLTSAGAEVNPVFLPVASGSPVTVPFAMNVLCAIGDNLANCGWNDQAAKTCAQGATWLDVVKVSN